MWESLKISNLKFSVIQTSGMSEQCEIRGVGAQSAQRTSVREHDEHRATKNFTTHSHDS
nr:hypothetical protein [Providencia stuartii]